MSKQRFTGETKACEPGATVYFSCMGCLKEFELSLEPRCRELGSDGIDPAEISHCPVCGMELLAFD